MLNLASLEGRDDPALGLREVESMLDGCVYFEDHEGRRSIHANKAVAVRAQLLVRTGDLDTAEPLVEQGIAHFTRLTGPTSAVTLGLRAARANLLRQREDPRAETEFLAVLTDQVATDLLQAAELTRGQLAELYFMQGRFREQSLLLEANVDSEERRTAALLLEGSESEALDAATYEVRHLGRFLSVVDTQHETEPTLVASAIEHWLRRKAITREIVARFARLADDLPDSPQTAELRSVRARLDEDLRINSERFVRPTDEWAKRQQRIQADRARAEELERAVGRSTPLRGLAILQSDLVATLPAALGETTVLLEICALAAHRITPADAADESWEHGYAVFAVAGGSNGPPRYRWLGSHDKLDTLVRQTLDQIGNGQRSRDVSGAPAADAGSATFSVSVSQGIQALADALGALLPAGTDRVIVSADSMLGALPFQILPAESGQWIDAYELTYVVSGLDLLRSSSSHAASGPPLVLAAPRFSRSGRTTPFGDLDGARQEGVDVAEVLATTPLVGDEATKSAVLSAVRPEVLHLATHAFFQEATGVQITMSAADPPADPNAVPQPVTMANLEWADRNDLRRQLLRAGLAFAGANDADFEQRQAKPPDRDLDYGQLLGLDLARLDLSATELVVLSACDTGKGRAIIAQGLWGLPLALQAAGARCTVSSLWRVDDDSTRALMSAFYDELARGSRSAAALRTAGLAVRKIHPEPRYWAPFVLIGVNHPLRRFITTEALHN